MTLAKILAVIDGGSGSEAALLAALELGRGFSARVELLHAQIDPETVAPVVGEGMSGVAMDQIVESLRADSETRLEHARALFARHCEEAGVETVEPHDVGAAGRFVVAFHHAVGPEAEPIRRLGRLSDLVVMARAGEAGNGDLPAGFDAALFDSGRPVLLVPAEPAEGFGRTVALAWDGSREAARAATAALPFLAKAERVVILTAREGSGAETAPSALAGYLALHGIEARNWAFTPEAGGIGAALLAEAKEAGADLMAMGGYGHSRLRELVLGGATREVLEAAPIPVLMVH